MANVGKPAGSIGFPPEVRCTLANSQAQRCARAMRLGGKPHVPANSCAEHRTGADRQQRPLVPRSRSWRRLTASVRHEYHRRGKEVRQHQWSWAKECVPFLSTCVPGVTALPYRRARKGKPHAVCAVSACQPGCRQVLCRVCQPFGPNLWVMRDAEPLRCSLLRSLCHPPDRRGDSHASQPATATRGRGGGAFPHADPSHHGAAATRQARLVPHPDLDLWSRRDSAGGGAQRTHLYTARPRRAGRRPGLDR